MVWRTCSERLFWSKIGAEEGAPCLCRIVWLRDGCQHAFRST